MRRGESLVSMTLSSAEHLAGSAKRSYCGLAPDAASAFDGSFFRF